MAQARLHAVARQLRSLVAARGLIETADGPLLERFIAQRDEVAFAALLRRHGPMVLAVGRRILRHDQDAEDIFQAAFLLLAKQARSIRKRESVGCWLHGVAHRLAVRVKTQAAHRQTREREAAAMRGTRSGGEAAWDELQAILDVELARLPEKYRAAIILCCLEAKTQEEAAQQLGCPLGTVRSRLARGRAMLHQRLTARGLTLSAAALATALTACAAVGSPPVVLAKVTLQAVVRIAAGQAARDTVASSVAALAEAGVQTALGAKAKLAILLILAASLIGSVGVAVGSRSDEKPESAKRKPALTNQEARADSNGDPLPAGAVARIGTLRWRHEGEAGSLAFSADGKMLAATNQDRTILLFDTASGKRLYRVKPDAPPRETGFGIGPLAFSPDGTYLAWQAGYGTVHLWDPTTKQHVRTLTAKDDGRGPPAQFPKIRFSPDGKCLAAVAAPDHIAVWDVASGKEVASIHGHNHGNPPIVFSPDGKMIAVSSTPVVQLFDASTGNKIRSFDTDQRWALALAFSPDGKAIASGAEERIILSEVATGKETGRLDRPKGKIGGVLDLAFTPDGKSLVSCDEDGRAIIWDIATRKERFILDSHGWIGRSMALSPDGKTVALGTVYNVIRLWDVTTGKERFPDPPGHDAPVHAVAFSPDGKLLVTGGENRRIHLWDAVSGRHLRHLQGQSAKAVSFSPDGKRLAAGWINDANARIWDTATGEEVSKVTHDASKGVQGIVFAPDGKTFVSLDRLGQGNSGRMNVWDAARGKRLRHVMLPGMLWPECLALSPDGKLAVVGCHADSPVRLCDVERGKELGPVPSDQAVVVSAVFSPDGRILATCGVDRTVCLWETASRRLIAQLQKHDRSVAALAFSPDGRVLASADGGPVSRFWQANPKQRIHLWEVASGTELTHLSGHDSDVTSLAFSPDGKRLVSGLSNGSVLVWDIATRAVVTTPAPVEIGPKELDALWTDLASDDGSKAFAAVWKLARSPAAVAYLRARIQPTETASEKQLARWIADLDSAVFADRDQASRELERQGELAEPLLRRALAADPSPEVRRRIEALLSKLQGPVTSAEALRSIRAVEVLEHIATPEARELLRKLATGAADARLTREAKAGLERLERKPAGAR